MGDEQLSERRLRSPEVAIAWDVNTQRKSQSSELN